MGVGRGHGQPLKFGPCLYNLDVHGSLKKAMMIIMMTIMMMTMFLIPVIMAHYVYMYVCMYVCMYMYVCKMDGRTDR